METKTKNGQGTKSDAAQTKDTEKGATTLAVVEKKQLPNSPIAERLKRIHECHTLSERRKVLVETQDDLFDFEAGLSENDKITCTNGRRETVEIKKADAVKKVLELLKREVEGAIQQTDADLLSASL